jgi:hypothetical protein
MKKKFWQKGHVVLFYSNHVGSLYPICTLGFNISWILVLQMGHTAICVKHIVKWRYVIYDFAWFGVKNFYKKNLYQLFSELMHLHIKCLNWCSCQNMLVTIVVIKVIDNVILIWGLIYPLILPYELSIKFTKMKIILQNFKIKDEYPQVVTIVCNFNHIYTST